MFCYVGFFRSCGNEPLEIRPRKVSMFLLTEVTQCFCLPLLLMPIGMV